MITHDGLDTLLHALDALDLPAGTWVATDADGTLWAADVADAAWHRLLGARGVRAPGAALLARLVADAAGLASTGDPHADAAALYDAYGRGVVDDWVMLEAMTGCYAGWTPGELRAFGAAVGREVAARAYETTRPLLDALAARGLRVAVVSGSPRLLVEESVRALGLPTPPLVVGVDLEADGPHAADDGALSPRLARPIPWEAGKVDALRARGVEHQVALGDTLGDLALLEAAPALRVLVHPRPGLRARAQGQAGPWHVLAPARTISGEPVRPRDVDRAIA